MSEAAVRAALRQQAAGCRELGSPFMARLMDVLAERLDDRSPVGAKVLGWGGDPLADALPLRIAGGLHALARVRPGSFLARCYPPGDQPAPETLWQAVSAVLNDPFLLPWLARAPQTNEVGRSAVLIAGLLIVAARTALPIRLFEVGASAGLNLGLDRYAMQLGTTRAGAPASPVRLEPRWDGPSPPPGEVRIVGRHGVDLAPMNPALVEDRERLLAYVWPDQAERLHRLQSACALADSAGTTVQQDDAAPWTERMLIPAPGEVSVLMHSIAFQYFPAESQARITAHMEQAGQCATATAALAWLRLEPEPGVTGAALRLRFWPDGTDTLLASAGAHGQWVTWR